MKQFFFFFETTVTYMWNEPRQNNRSVNTHMIEQLALRRLFKIHHGVFFFTSIPAFPDRRLPDGACGNSNIVCTINSIKIQNSSGGKRIYMEHHVSRSAAWKFLFYHPSLTVQQSVIAIYVGEIMWKVIRIHQFDFWNRGSYELTACTEWENSGGGGLSLWTQVLHQCFVKMSHRNEKGRFTAGYN